MSAELAEVDTTMRLTVVSWKRPKASYEYHRSYLIQFWKRKHNEEVMQGRTEELHWVDVPRTWLVQAPFLLQQIQQHRTWAVETKRTYVNALKQILRLEAEKNDLKPDDQMALLDVIQQVSQSHAALTSETLRSEKDNLLHNEGRDSRWMPWSDIVALAPGLERRIDQKQLHVYQLRQMLLLLRLYTLQPAPLRLNYGAARLFPSDAECATLEASNENYVTRLAGGCYRFHLNHDKVAGSRGTTVIPLHETICRQIDELESLYGYRRYLLTQNSNLLKPLDEPGRLRTGSTQMLAAIPVPSEERPSLLNVCTIRSAFATHFLDQAPSENAVETMAAAMRTSPAMMRVYYRKIVTPVPSATTPTPEPTN